jgi:hypothetical protein
MQVCAQSFAVRISSSKIYVVRNIHYNDFSEVFEPLSEVKEAVSSLYLLKSTTVFSFYLFITGLIFRTLVEYLIKTGPSHCRHGACDEYNKG